MADFIAPDNDCLRYVKAPVEHAIVVVESSFNPFAIGVVGGALARQPRNKAEAVATAIALKAQGYNFSMGCRQVNQANLVKYGLNLDSVFDPLKNSAVGSAIYDECRIRATAKFGDSHLATKAALSCYYSGNFNRGQQKEGNSPSYADKVLGSLPESAQQEMALAIPVIAVKNRKSNHQANKLAIPATAERALIQQTDQKQAASWDVFKDF
jgi:type IV secretion system protein VirB1